MSEDGEQFQFGEAPRHWPGYDVARAPRARSQADRLNPAHQPERLRELIFAGYSGAVLDSELLELVLGRVVPVLEAARLATRLIDRFGDFSRAVSATPAQLAQVPGAREAVVQELKVVEAAAQRLARARVVGRNALGSWSDLVAYCRIVMAHRDVESFRVLFLDGRNMLIADEELQRGTVNHVSVYPREVVRRALELNATSLILLHNHPSGDPAPSDADIEMTDRIREACEVLGLVLHDHMVVGAAGHVSFRQLGLI